MTRRRGRVRVSPVNLASPRGQDCTDPGRAETSARSTGGIAQADRGRREVGSTAPNPDLTAGARSASRGLGA